jgi:transposase-like protein
LERELGVTYKTAWRMFHQIRKMMEDDEPLDGEVEIDEAYIHPNPTKRTTAKPHESKTILGMTERGGRVIAKHVKSSGVRVLSPVIQKYVSKDSIVFTDEHGSYRQLAKNGYTHVSVNHRAGEYVKGNIHTQNIENFWSNLKRGIHGVYRGVGKEHLQNYINEYAWRYSHRTDVRPLFLTLLETVSS